MSNIGHFFRMPFYIGKGIRYKLSGWLYTPKPRVIEFPVNDRCNSRCVMCNRWRKKVKDEISTAKISEVFSNKLFSKVELVNIHGGEPTLRSDLAEIFKIIHDSCPNLKQMWLSTNGLNPERIKTRVCEILEVLNFNKIKSLAVNVSIDGDKETHEKIRGVKGGFDQAINTLKIIKELKRNYPVDVYISTVIQPLNLHKIEKVECIGKDLEMPVYFIPMMWDTFFNIKPSPELSFSQNDIKVYKELIEEKHAKGHSTTDMYWDNFLNQMEGKKRNIPCAFDRYVLSLYPTGEILPCSREDWIVYGNIYEQEVDDIWFGSKSKYIRERMKNEVCPTCPNMCLAEFSLQEEFFAYLRFYFKKKLLKLPFSRKTLRQSP